jgi:hypothetical protein
MWVHRVEKGLWSPRCLCPLTGHSLRILFVGISSSEPARNPTIAMLHYVQYEIKYTPFQLSMDETCRVFMKYFNLLNLYFVFPRD